MPGEGKLFVELLNIHVTQAMPRGDVTVHMPDRGPGRDQSPAQVKGDGANFSQRVHTNETLLNFAARVCWGRQPILACAILAPERPTCQPPPRSAWWLVCPRHGLLWFQFESGPVFPPPVPLA